MTVRFHLNAVSGLARTRGDLGALTLYYAVSRRILRGPSRFSGHNSRCSAFSSLTTTKFAIKFSTKRVWTAAAFKLSALIDMVTVRVTIWSVIRSFKCRETEKVFQYERTLAWSEAIRKAALRKLYMLDAASSLLDLRSPPANRLEKLRGDREGQYSIRISDQWRICFEWRSGDAWNVKIVDYH